MTFFPGQQLSARAILAVTLAALCLTSCGGSESTAPVTVTVLDVTVPLVQGVTCDQGGVGIEFTGEAGKTVTILATGASNQTPRFYLYNPSYGTLLGASSAYGANRARLIFALTESGVHHLTVCEANGVGGSVRVTVTVPAL